MAYQFLGADTSSNPGYNRNDLALIAGKPLTLDANSLDTIQLNSVINWLLDTVPTHAASEEKFLETSINRGFDFLYKYVARSKSNVSPYPVGKYEKVVFLNEVKKDKVAGRIYEYRISSQSVTYANRFLDEENQLSIRDLYDNLLKVQTDPYEFLRIMKYASTWGLYADGTYPEQSPIWFRQCLTYNWLKTSFDMLNQSKITDSKLLLDSLSNAAQFEKKMFSAIQSPASIIIDIVERDFDFNNRFPKTIKNIRIGVFSDLYLPKSFQDECFKAVNDLKFLINENIKKMAAQQANLESPSGFVPTDNFRKDYRENPLIIYDESKKSFVDISKNSILNFTKFEIPATALQIKSFSDATSILREAKRNIIIPEGVMSTEQMRNLKPDSPKKNSILPWVAGGIVAAVAVKEMTS